MTIKAESLKSKYKSDILAKRELLIHLYRKLSPALTKTNIYIRYISRGVSETVAYNIKCKGRKIEATCNKLFSITTSEMKFIGSKELLILYRTKRNGTVELKIKKGFQCGKDFVVLVGLTDYFNFITDSEQKYSSKIRNTASSKPDHQYTNQTIIQPLITHPEERIWAGRTPPAEAPGPGRSEDQARQDETILHD